MTVPVVISRDQIKQFQTQMLDAFRIQRPSKDAHIPDEFVSRYMTSLYKFIGGKNVATLNPSFSYLDEKTDNNDFDFNKILSGSNEYDSIVGFVPKKVSANTELAEALGDNLAEIDFGKSEDSLVDESMKLVHAELYFAVENETVPLTSIKAFSTRGENLVALNGGQVIRMNDTNLLAFNVTKIVDNWISWPAIERRLFLRILDSEDKTMPLDSLLDKIHVFGVGFLVEADDDEIVAPNRYKREASENDIDDEEPAEAPTASSFKPRPLDILTRPRTGRCRLMTLYIDFNDIGWGDFILAPTGFSANYCDGGCSFPLDVSLNPSNHATVQTLVHLIDKNKTSEALCAPISMDTPLSFLLLADNRVIIKKFSEMTVTKCGCQ
uniref:TGF-beta family profile domain-containing protein n=1 Tax=Panagrolaimus sp. JU765 TaxID=591449 RepID=A0AC34QDP5_9BILA